MMRQNDQEDEKMNDKLVHINEPKSPQPHSQTKTKNKKPKLDHLFGYQPSRNAPPPPYTMTPNYSTHTINNHQITEKGKSLTSIQPILLSHKSLHTLRMIDLSDNKIQSIQCLTWIELPMLGTLCLSKIYHYHRQKSNQQHQFIKDALLASSQIYRHHIQSSYIIPEPQPNISQQIQNQDNVLIKCLEQIKQVIFLLHIQNARIDGMRLDIQDGGEECNKKRIDDNLQYQRELQKQNYLPSVRLDQNQSNHKPK